MSAENLTSAKKPLSPPSTQHPNPIQPKKTATLRLHPKLKSPTPKTPPSHIPHQSRFPSLPSTHHPPKQRPPSSPPPLNTRRGACFTSRHQPQTPTNQPQPSSCRPYTAHTWPPAACKMRSKLSGRVHVAQTGQRNERRSSSFVWALVIPARGCAQTAAVRIPCRGKGVQVDGEISDAACEPVSGGFRGW